MIVSFKGGAEPVEMDADGEPPFATFLFAPHPVNRAGRVAAWIVEVEVPSQLVTIATRGGAAEPRVRGRESLKIILSARPKVRFTVAVQVVTDCVQLL